MLSQGLQVLFCLPANAGFALADSHRGETSASSVLWRGWGLSAHASRGRAAVSIVSSEGLSGRRAVRERISGRRATGRFAGGATALTSQPFPVRVGEAGAADKARARTAASGRGGTHCLPSQILAFPLHGLRVGGEGPAVTWQRQAAGGEGRCLSPWSCGCLPRRADGPSQRPQPPVVGRGAAFAQRALCAAGRLSHPQQGSQRPWL